MRIWNQLLVTTERIISRLGASQAINRLYDRLQGINTAGDIGLKALGLDNAEMVHYVPSSWFTFNRISQIIPFSKDDVFVDFGSGKGRIVYMAARNYPFKRVIGVEISKDLNNLARVNIEKNFRKLKCKDVKLVTSDVLQYEIPRDMTIAYFYTPFTGSLFREVVQRIGHSIDSREDRCLWVILLWPHVSPRASEYKANNEILRKCSWLEKVEEMVNKSTVITVYRAIQA